MTDDASRHKAPDLVGLVAAETGRDETIAAARHVRACRSCTEELVDLVVGHAALTAAASTDRDLDRSPWTIHADGVGVDRTTCPEPERDDAQVSAALPPIVPASDPGATTPEARKRPGVALVLAAAAAVVVLGALGMVALAGGHRGAPPVVAQGPLRPLQAPSAVSGTVTVLAQGTVRHMIVRTRNLSSPPSQKFYEVWLLDPATQKMLPVGVLPPSGSGAYDVSAGIMAGYSAVDVSLQPDNGNPAHSQTSMLRASL